MPNIGALLKHEIARLARREVRGETKVTKKATVQYRHDIAALKRRVSALERAIVSSRHAATAKPPEGKPPSDGKLRFVAKGQRAQRRRLGLSAEGYARLVGVSANSVYNWEQGHATPRPEQLQKIAALRTIGKREAQAALGRLGAKGRKRKERGR